MNIDQPTKTNTAFTVRFWGVRGQVPTPGRETYRFGGNTPCLEINAGDQRFIFDGGTGLRMLGNALLAQMPIEAHLFFTHANWDRIQGFPFFVPAFIPINHFHIYGTKTPEGRTFEDSLSKQMHGPNFPVPIQVMGAKLEFHSLKAGDEFIFESARIKSALVHNQHQALGFRISYGNQTIVCATDSDIQDAENRSSLEKLAQNADLLILNTPVSHPNHQDIQQWQPLLDFSRAIAVKHLLISTHDPNCDDPELETLEASLKEHSDYLEFAKEGKVIALSD
ncbi:beta-lactamase [[Leptolyngbya] sp. PCC 7376]|uniref:MBL fold metallo-hydrolase n=1 Tax=[Leptolyngbya] sp. PCC 7376 TaxID=111781 RepID=UPI00029F3346|nr:MBL fold metallo-hydrolase [[Leptolyngbya] sp. PCC 7376]AFY37997.1 beta-lactamase [[Leptolyngbya] sp. PCC 7376]